VRRTGYFATIAGRRGSTRVMLRPPSRVFAHEPPALEPPREPVEPGPDEATAAVRAAPGPPAARPGPPQRGSRLGPEAQAQPPRATAPAHRFERPSVSAPAPPSRRRTAAGRAPEPEPGDDAARVDVPAVPDGPARRTPPATAEPTGSPPTKRPVDPGPPQVHIGAIDVTVVAPPQDARQPRPQPGAPAPRRIRPLRGPDQPLPGLGLAQR
jgi:hypothetical protein